MTEFSKNTQTAFEGNTIAGNVTIGSINQIINSSQPQMEGEPFKVPSVREG